MLNEKEIIQNIRSRREAIGAQQEQVAKRSGITRLAYTNIENGKSSPRMKNLVSILNTLDQMEKEFQQRFVRTNTLKSTLTKSA